MKYHEDYHEISQVHIIPSWFWPSAFTSFFTVSGMILQALKRFTGFLKTIGQILWSSRVDGLFLKPPSNHREKPTRDIAWWTPLKKWFPCHVPMMSPSFTHDLPIIYPWFTHDVSSIFPWFHHLPMICPWKQPISGCDIPASQRRRSPERLCCRAAPGGIASTGDRSLGAAAPGRGADRGSRQALGSPADVPRGGKLWENARENRRKMVGKMGNWWENAEKMGKSWENHGIGWIWLNKFKAESRLFDGEMPPIHWSLGDGFKATQKRGNCVFCFHIKQELTMWISNNLYLYIYWYVYI